MIAIVFALASAVFFGISNVYWTLALSKDIYPRVVFFRGFITICLFVFCWILISKFASGQKWMIETNQLNPKRILITLMITVGSSFGLYFFLHSLKYIQVSITVPLTSINIFNILTAILVLGEKPNCIHLLSFVLAGAGVFLIRIKREQTTGNWNKGLFFALLSSFFWGVTYALMKIPATWMGPIPLSVMLECCVLMMSIFWHRFSVKDNSETILIGSFQWLNYTVLACLLFGGTLFYMIAIRNIPILVLNILGNATLITSVFLGIIWRKEKLKNTDIIALIMILLSLVVVQMGI